MATNKRRGGIGNKGQITVGSGDVTGGDKITVILNMAPFEPPPDLEKLRADYLDHLRRAHRALDLKLPQLENFTRELLLEDVYVPLLARPELPAGETWERRLAGRLFEGEEAITKPPDTILRDSTIGKLQMIWLKTSVVPVAVEQALAEKPHVVVIGDPGSGKTTLLKHLALRLAAELNAPLPILLPLNAYADALTRGDRNLQAYLADYFAGRAKGLAKVGPLFDKAIEQGRAVILLDGLDEVQRDRPHLVDKVEAFSREAAEHGNKLVVTSRIVGYRESPLDPKEWSLYTLLDFDRKAIENFAGKWCLAFERSTLGDTPEARAAAEVERKSLLEALDANPGVEKLASNPLLLTVLALIKRQGVTLPNRRVELYEIYLKTLISAWNKSRALDKRPVGPPMDYLETVTVLGPLALWLREENPTAGLVTEERLIEWLTNYYAGDEWRLPRGEAMKRAREFLGGVRQYSNLLIERGQGRWGFIHLTFEEALAARGLVLLGQLKLDDSLAVIEKHLTDPAWRETILLAVGIWGLVREQPRVAGEVARAMLKWGHEGVLLAGACLEDVGELGLGRIAKQEITSALLAANRNRSLPPTVQRDAGFILGRTGRVPDDLDLFIHIPAGPFLYGPDKRMVVIEQPFAIAKYPVTNLQYKRFMDAGGYERQEFWGEEGWAWRTETYDSKAPDYLKDWLAERPLKKRNEPFFWHDAKWKNPLAPVVGINWFETEAYYNWLSKEKGKLFRLPTEQEWECVARLTDGREFPWGNKFDRNRLNSGEFWGEEIFDAMSTTIVGQFAEGNSQAGISDMSGNIWEWTDSWYDTKKIFRVVRGGSWFNDVRGVRCAFRLKRLPVFFDNVLGFRVLSHGATEDFVGW